MVAYFAEGPSADALTFLSLTELYSEGQRKGEFVFSPSNPSPSLAGVVIKGEVHKKVRPQSPVPFPDVLGAGTEEMWAFGGQGQGWPMCV